MTTHRLKTFALSASLAIGASGAPAGAAELDTILSTANEVHAEARQAQSRVEEINEDTRKLLSDFKTVMKEVEGLRIYNAQLERQINNQETEMAQLNVSIDQVTLVERQVSPLMLRMIDGIEQFISLDVPFLLDERMGRVERLREIVDRADVEVSEKFSQVLNAYQIENEFGRTAEAYNAELELDGRTLNVDFLRMGRVALVYQTTDGESSGVWNNGERRWQSLDQSYNSSIRNGIRIARQQAAVNLITLPIPGAEAAQ